MNRIAKQRELLGMLPEDLATRAGIHIATLREIERGVGRRIQARIRRNLAKVLKSNPANLFTSDGVAR